MTKNAIITWISVVSGLITIILVFDNPFADKAKLSVYVESQEVLSYWLTEGEEEEYDTNYALKLTLKNVGELVANKVHVRVKDANGFAVIKQGREYNKVEKSSSIYIDRVEPGAKFEIYYWGAFYSVSHFFIDDNFVISSLDSGKAEIRADIKGDSIIWYVEKYFMFIVMFFFLLLWVPISVFSRKSIDSEKKKDFQSELDKLSHAWNVGLISESEFQEKGRMLLESTSADEDRT